MHLGIIGSRSFNNYNLLKKVIQKYIITWDVSYIVSGGADGADKLAEQYAEEYKIPTKIYLADWQKYGKRAGFIRNNDIWVNSDCIVAFWDGQSPGTKHSFELSKKYNKPFLVVEYNSKKVYWYTDPSNIINTTYYSKKQIRNTNTDFENTKITF